MVASFSCHYSTCCKPELIGAEMEVFYSSRFFHLYCPTSIGWKARRARDVCCSNGLEGWIGRMGIERSTRWIWIFVTSLTISIISVESSPSFSCPSRLLFFISPPDSFLSSALLQSALVLLKHLENSQQINLLSYLRSIVPCPSWAMKSNNFVIIHKDFNQRYIVSWILVLMTKGFARRFIISTLTFVLWSPSPDMLKIILNDYHIMKCQQKRLLLLQKPKPIQLRTMRPQHLQSRNHTHAREVLFMSEDLSSIF